MSKEEQNNDTEGFCQFDKQHSTSQRRESDVHLMSLWAPLRSLIGHDKIWLVRWHTAQNRMGFLWSPHGMEAQDQAKEL